MVDLATTTDKRRSLLMVPYTRPDRLLLAAIGGVLLITGVIGLIVFIGWQIAH